MISIDERSWKESLLNGNNEEFSRNNPCEETLSSWIFEGKASSNKIHEEASTKRISESRDDEETTSRRVSKESNSWRIFRDSQYQVSCEEEVAMDDESMKETSKGSCQNSWKDVFKYIHDDTSKDSYEAPS